MDPPESSVNRIGRTIWTVWGYLSGAVARYLRPEVTDEGNQSVRTRTEDIDLKSAVNKINKEVTANNFNNEGKKTNQIDSAEVKCSPINARVQVASVPWENTDVVKDDSNDELHVHTTKKQTYHCAVWSTGTDSDNEGRMVGACVEKEAVSSDEVQAEKVYANNECKESETAHNLEETGKTEQKYGDNEDKEERDQNHEDEKCAKKREDAYKTDVMVQFEQDVEQEKQINMADHGETEGIAGFKNADEHLIEEKENDLDQKDQEKTENDEEQGLESQVQDLQKSEDPDNADVMVQCKLYGQDVEQDKLINMMDHGETGGIGGFKHADEHLIDDMEVQIVDQKDQGKIENDEDQGTESQVQDLLPQLEYLKKYSDEIAYVSKNEVEEMMPETRGVTEQDKENETVQDLEEIGQLKRNDGDNEDKEECDQSHEDEKCAMKSEDLDNTDVMVQSELYGQDVEQDKPINMMDHGETGGIGGFKHADAHLIDDMEVQIVYQKDQGKIEKDEDQGTESQVQDLLPQLEYLKKYSDEIAYVSKNEVEEMMPETRGVTEQDKENETVQDLEEIGQLKRNDGDNEDKEECNQNHEDEKCAMKSEDLDYADVMVQSELYGQDVEQEMQISMMDHAEKEGTGGFKHSNEHPIDEKEKQIVDQMDQEMTENDEEQGTESQVQDLLPQLEYFTEEADDLAKPERLKVMEKYSYDIDEFSKKGVEEVMHETEQDEDTTESEQDTTKYELMESVETLQRVSEELSEKKVPNVELKMTTVVDEFFETVDTLEDTLLSDSKRDTSENTPVTGTGSHVVAMKTEGMFSDLIVCEFPVELRKGPETALAETDLGCFEEIKTNLHDPQTLAEEQAEREAVITCSVEHSETLKAVDEAVETEQDIETLIESLGTTESQAHQEIDKTEFSLKEHVDLRTELMEETTETKISSEDEEAEPSEKESQSSVIRNVTLQSHELLEFTEGECKSSLGTMDTFNESLGNSSMSEIEIKHVAEEQTDVKPVLTRSLSPAEFLEETLHLQGESEQCAEEQEILETDVVKTALEYVEGITNQVLKEMIETEINFVQETEPLAGPSTEEPGDAKYQGPAQCVSADAFVLEEEGKLLGETMDSKVEMEVETTSSEVLKQTEQHISSPECETTEADGRRDQIQKVIAGETVLSSHEDLMEVSRPGMKRGFDSVSKDLPEVKTEGKFYLYLQAFEESSLDFTVQKSRIAVKNPLVRPPKDPRRLLFKASVEPFVPQPSPCSQKVEVSVSNKGVTGFKLPGLGAELPVLRKTEFGKKAREGGAAERTLQPQQKSVAVTEDSVKQEQVPAKPKWTPPRHPGMGSPFMMAELKSKLKKPVQE
ncbi:probable serine/threonine-protein kinase kinX [Sinocyclocheilus anshuiensis]|uniref:probable serine/threonine-protein kinase kinX n=1 Tax=Sinocyclocheilus anshuiensis TaxID=1608454 RepID=UPI0007B9F5DF|nr:PREDICTED: probable serine/threonine-protein kinase kinX [Sinocyclocheilus anshuiensis]